MSLGLRSTRRGTLSASLSALAVGLAFAAVAEARGAGGPSRLVDGSRPPRVPPALRAKSPGLVATRVRLVRMSRARTRVAACVPGERIPDSREVVERIGISGRTLTFLGLSGSVFACDRSPEGRPRPWCGRAAWPLRSGRVSDARLSICVDRHGRAIAAFAWLNPVPRAAWIVVDQPGFGEIYRVVGRLPVRVSAVAELSYGRATFRFREYDAEGVMLARRTITPAVAG